MKFFIALAGSLFLYLSAAASDSKSGLEAAARSSEKSAAQKHIGGAIMYGPAARAERNAKILIEALKAIPSGGLEAAAHNAAKAAEALLPISSDVSLDSADKAEAGGQLADPPLPLFSHKELAEALTHFEDPNHGGNLLHSLLRETGPLPDKGEADYIGRLLDQAASLPLKALGQALKKKDRSGYTPLRLARTAAHPYEGLFESLAIKYNSRLDTQANLYMTAGFFMGFAVMLGGVLHSSPSPSLEEIALPLSLAAASACAGCCAYFKSLKKQIEPERLF